jgi:hypothetical protein
VEPVWGPGPTEDRLICGRLDGDANLQLLDLRDGGQVEILRMKGFQSPLAWLRDGLVLIHDKPEGGAKGGEYSGMDVLTLNPRDGSVHELLDEPFNEWAATLSPDGKWLAWVSDETGRPEVYVRPMDAPGAKARVSEDGGTEPVWSRRGDELFFRNLQFLCSVRTPQAPGKPFGRPKELFHGPYRKGFDHKPDYDVWEDPVAGTRFLMVKGAYGLSSRLEVLLDFRDGLGRR